MLWCLYWLATSKKYPQKDSPALPLVLYYFSVVSAALVSNLFSSTVKAWRNIFKQNLRGPATLLKVKQNVRIRKHSGCCVVLCERAWSDFGVRTTVTAATAFVLWLDTAASQTEMTISSVQKMHFQLMSCLKCNSIGFQTWMLCLWIIFVHRCFCFWFQCWLLW